jgi:hypothetical protein
LLLLGSLFDTGFIVIVVLSGSLDTPKLFVTTSWNLRTILFDVVCGAVKVGLDEDELLKATAGPEV